MPTVCDPAVIPGNDAYRAALFAELRRHFRFTPRGVLESDELDAMRPPNGWTYLPKSPQGGVFNRGAHGWCFHAAPRFEVALSHAVPAGCRSWRVVFTNGHVGHTAGIRYALDLAISASVVCAGLWHVATGHPVHHWQDDFLPYEDQTALLEIARMDPDVGADALRHRLGIRRVP